MKEKNVCANQADSINFEILLKPVWEGEISYQESVLPVMGEANSLLPIKLLYPIKEIVKVQNAALTTTYQENVDFIVENGELLILRNGKIPIMTYEEFHPTSGQAAFEARGGGYVCFNEGSYFHDRQIVVTYKHDAKYTGYIPDGKAHLLRNLHNKLAQKEDIKMLVFGDSISVGANVSGFINVSPYLPTYSELFAKGLKQTYGVNVHITNESVGGKDSYWGKQNIEDILKGMQDVDLAIVAFGMNDVGANGSSFTSNIRSINEAIQKAYPEADIIMLATMLPNYDAIHFYGNQEVFYSYMQDLETEGVALANMTSVHSSLLQRKCYADMTGNNVNHTNDYMSRVYAQTLLTTVAEKVERPAANDSSNSDRSDVQNFIKGCNATISMNCVGVISLLAIAQICRKRG